MRNEDVCEAFFNREEALGSNLRSTGNKLISFSTCIAQWDYSYLFLNKTKYSISTGKHQYYLSKIANANMNQMYIIELDNVPMYENNLVEYECRR